jgi:hypothetical protein
MTSLESELHLIGDHLQTAWRADARHARRRRRALLAASLGALLVLTGAAIASDLFPISLTKTTSSPAPAALENLRATYQPVGKPLAPWQKSLKLDLAKAVVIARVTSRQTGPLSIIVVPAKHGLCVDAARPDGTSYLGGCQQEVHLRGARADHSVSLYIIVDGRTTNGVYHPPLGLSILTAPPHAARIDVRERDASKLPAIISHGWLLFLNPRPGGATVLVRVYDKAGKRLLSYYG